ncbi:MAG: hypothetical protein MRY83_04215, partial [Flavobacteriales bacterium]|nr:hypothetical protein [Flavobacteriales bacterium]
MAIKLSILNSNFIIKTGLETILEKIPNVEIHINKETSPYSFIRETNPDVILIDYCSENYSIADLERLISLNSDLKVIGITEMQSRHTFQTAIRLGIHGHLLNCCDEEELNGAIHSVTRNERFFCGKILNVLEETQNESCDPIVLSPR